MCKIFQSLRAHLLLREAEIIRRSGCFDVSFYRSTQQIADDVDPVLHYVTEGEANGAQPTLFFDPAWWKKARTFPFRFNCFADYLTSPYRWVVTPSPYMILRQDLGPAPVETSPLAAYLSSAGEAGLLPTPLFDEKFYLTRNPDVGASGVPPLMHFIFSGRIEGRSPSASFDASYYRERYLANHGQDIEPLRHFIMEGAARGYAPCRAIDPAILQRRHGDDLLAALCTYQSQERDTLAALTHSALPPPGGRFDRLDNWPWENPREVDSRGRILYFGRRPPTIEEERILSRIARDRTAGQLWIATPEHFGRDMAHRLVAPYLSIDPNDAGVWPALLRAAQQAGPYLEVLALDPSDVASAEVAAIWPDLRISTLSNFTPSILPTQQKRSISVVIPSFNHARYIERRVQSIASQTRKPCEIIFIDDASSDGSANFARALLAEIDIPSQVVARVVNSGNPAAIWRQGAQMASGDLLWVAESDDAAAPQLTERLAAFFDRDDAIKLAYCQSAIIRGDGVLLADDHLAYTDPISQNRWLQPYIVNGVDEINTALAIKNAIPNASAVLMDRRAVCSVIDNAVHYRFAADWVLYLSLAKMGKIAFSPEVLNFKRSHGVNLTDVGEEDGRVLLESTRIRRQLLAMGVPHATADAIRVQHLDDLCRALTLRRIEDVSGEFRLDDVYP